MNIDQGRWLMREYPFFMIILDL